MDLPIFWLTVGRNLKQVVDQLSFWICEEKPPGERRTDETLFHHRHQNARLQTKNPTKKEKYRAKRQKSLTEPSLTHDVVVAVATKGRDEGTNIIISIIFIIMPTTAKDPFATNLELSNRKHPASRVSVVLVIE